MNSCSLLAHSVCLKCSEMRLLKIWTDLSFLIPPVEPSVSEAEMDPEDPCLENLMDRGARVGLESIGSHRVGHD